MRGRFITFEGGEGTGKSTQAALLAERLRRSAIEVVLTREPGGSLGAEIIRHVLLSGAAAPLGPVAEALLFAAARADHVENTIRPALERGQWVVCDRFLDSTRAYQGALGKVDARIIRALERITVGVTAPDLTLILDLPTRVGLERASARRGAGKADRFEDEAADFHRKLRKAFKDIAKANPERCVVIDARGGKEAIAEQVWNVVAARLAPTAAPALLERAEP